VTTMVTEKDKEREKERKNIIIKKKY